MTRLQISGKCQRRDDVLGVGVCGLATEDWLPILTVDNVHLVDARLRLLEQRGPLVEPARIHEEDVVDPDEA